MEGDQDRELLSDSDPPSPSLSPPPRPLSPASFDRERHVTFLEMMYHMLPYHYQSQEINHLTLAYFVISGLDILDALDRVHKDAVAGWVLSFQAHPRSKADLGNGQFYGFHGSRSSQFPSKDNAIFIQNGSHLASTYCALAILKIVGYNLSNIDSASMLTSMRSLQQSDGSFMPIHIGAERDLRFLYCAAAICFMLNNWNGMDREKAKEYILNCQSYDGGFGLTPGSESHAKQALDISLKHVNVFRSSSTGIAIYTGGAAYCAIASLRLMGFIGDDCLSNASVLSSKANIWSLLDWSLQRQVADGGIQGRPNKASDTCYAFWIGATMGTLGANKFIDERGLRNFLLTCQSEYGGFGKFPEELPDLYHSYYGLAAFSILGEGGLKPLCLELGVTEGAATGL